MQGKLLGWSQIRKNAAEFVAEWTGETYEAGESQSFWTELLAVYGIRRRNVARFEERARRADGGRGFIDLFWPGVLIAEQKSAGKDLEAAERQALDYLDGVTDAEMPRYVITCDFETFRLRDLDTPPGEDGVVTFPLSELPREAERFGFMAGYQKRKFGSEEQATASIKAAQLMADLYLELDKTGYDEHEASVFLVRTLFCLFADDSGLWERDLMTEFIETRTNEDGSDLGAQLSAVFQALSRPVEKRMKTADELILRFPHVNGSLFDGPLSIPYFDKTMRDKLIAACHFNWGEISPAIFGSLFQAVKSKEARRELGEHYTTETNILKVIEPLFLDELRQRFIKEQHNLAGLRKLQRDMGQMRFLDPACGCGNFLIVAYREMRALELQILVRIQELDKRSMQTSLVLQKDDTVLVHLSNFYGIELEEWPATIARTAMFLVQHQANQDMALKVGQAPDMLPLHDAATIVQANALRTDWADIVPPSENVYVMGNPPFIGQYTKSGEQTEDMKAVWGADYDGYLDYVTGWHAQASRYFASCPVGQFAYVTTNSIVQGQPVPALFGPLHRDGWSIRFAHRTFAWMSEAPGAAGVHCVIVGFSKGRNISSARLFSYERAKGHPVEQPAKVINPYLTDGPWVLVDKRSTILSKLPPVAYGSKPADGGHLIVEADEYATFAADPIASRYLRTYVGARELIHGHERWCLWLEELNPVDLGKSQLLRDRVDASRRFRAESKPSGDAYKLRETPHLFRPNRALPRTSYLCIPIHVSEERRYFPAARFSPDVISSNANFVAPDSEGYALAVISSSMFIVWQKTVGGRLESRLRFSNTLVWNTLPLPEVDPATRVQIVDAGRAVLDARDLHPERSLADHYNPLAMDPALLKAHRDLDKVVDKAFGCKVSDPTEQDRQETLFARYSELTSEGQLPAPSKGRRARQS